MTPRRHSRWFVHFDHPWSSCVRDDGAPVRLYVHTPHGCLMVGARAMAAWRGHYFASPVLWIPSR